MTAGGVYIPASNLVMVCSMHHTCLQPVLRFHDKAN